jgi:hypothetical protein
MGTRDKPREVANLSMIGANHAVSAAGNYIGSFVHDECDFDFSFFFKEVKKTMNGSNDPCREYF